MCQIGQADHAAEKRAKEEAPYAVACVLFLLLLLPPPPPALQLYSSIPHVQAEKKHQEVLEDRDRISGDMRQLQNDKDFDACVRIMSTCMNGFECVWLGRMLNSGQSRRWNESTRRLTLATHPTST